MRLDQLLSDAEFPEAFSQIFSLGATENNVCYMSEALKPAVQRSCYLKPLTIFSMLHGTMQQKYGIFGKMEKRSMTFVLMNEIFPKMA